MQSNKTKLQNYFGVFTPSALSVVWGFFLSVVAIVLNQFDSIKGYLQLPHNLELSKVFGSWADKILTTVIGQTRTETLVVGLFWAVVGMVVYLFLRGLAGFAMQFDDDVSVRGYVWPKGADRTAPLRQLAKQAAFRFGAFILLVIAVWGPLAAVLRGPVFVNFLGTNKIVQYVVWLLAGLLVWHIITILIRLIAFKARIFG